MAPGTQLPKPMLPPTTAEMIRSALPSIKLAASTNEMIRRTSPKATLSPTVVEMIRSALPKLQEDPQRQSLADVMREAYPKQSLADVMREALPKMTLSEATAQMVREALPKFGDAMAWQGLAQQTLRDLQPDYPAILRDVRSAGFTREALGVAEAIGSLERLDEPRNVRWLVSLPVPALLNLFSLYLGLLLALSFVAEDMGRDVPGAVQHAIGVVAAGAAAIAATLNARDRESN